MSQPNLESVGVPTVLKKKAVWDVYTVMLILSLVAVLLGCLFLLLEIGEYGWQTKPVSAVSHSWDRVAQHWSA